MTFLLLITNQFPFGDREQFLETELKFLEQEFDQVIIAPKQVSRKQRVIAGSVEVDVSLAEALANGRKLSLLIPGINEWSKIFSSKNPLVALRNSFLFHARACSVYQWLQMKVQGLDGAVILYSYWCDESALANSWLTEKLESCRRIFSFTRAHGADVYGYRHRSGVLPLRSQIYSGLDAAFYVSENGLNYTKKNYKCRKSNLQVSRLGVFGFNNTLTKSSTDGTMRIISCSHANKVKRLDRLVDVLCELEKFPSAPKIEWTHIGAGPLFDEIVKDAETRLQKTKMKFEGALSNSDVYKFHNNHPADIFINVSDSEGFPVSIMEALSCGIPVFAPAVGGIPELIGSDNGWVFDVGSSIGEIASSLAAALGECHEKRDAARKLWENELDANRNYKKFCDTVKKLASDKFQNPAHA